MTVDEFIKALQELSKAGQGCFKVMAFPDSYGKTGRLPAVVEKKNLTPVDSLKVLLIDPDEG